MWFIKQLAKWIQEYSPGPAIDFHSDCMCNEMLTIVVFYCVLTVLAESIHFRPLRHIVRFCLVFSEVT
jgi:hypothetical protein